MTINPLESNEMTFVPGSPPSTGETSSLEHQPLLSEEVKTQLSPKSIANTTIIVDDEVNKTLLVGSKVHKRLPIFKRISLPFLTQFSRGIRS